MTYLNAKKLIELSLEQNLFNLHEGYILLFKKNAHTQTEGWYMAEKEEVIQLIKDDTTGQSVLIQALNNKGIVFNEI